MPGQTPITNNWGGKDEQSLVICGNRNGHQSTE